jgi:hypothetical protein
MLARCPQEGCSEPLLLAHGFTIEQMIDLVRTGLATAAADRIVAGAHEFEVVTLRITAEGRQALAKA